MCNSEVPRNMHVFLFQDGRFWSCSFCLFFALLTSVRSQGFSFNTRCALDTKLTSSSGLLSLNGGQSFWSQADNSSPDELYEINTDCHILRTLKILKSPKTDWEDICSDPFGNVYIGDFGNNNNNRKNLRILILRDPAHASSDSIVPEIIEFNYANQLEFPPAADLRNFDMEAMVWNEDSLHLFSKNRTNPFTGYTYQYSLPAKAGTYSLQPVDSFKTGEGLMLFYWVTGAAFNPKTREFTLLSHDRLWLFRNVDGNRFLKGPASEVLLPSYTQKEGICAAGDRRWFITDEYNPTLRQGANLYELNMDPADLNDVADPSLDMIILNNPAGNLLQLQFPNFNASLRESLQILDLAGKLLMDVPIEDFRLSVTVNMLSKGMYLLRKHSKSRNKPCHKLLLLLD